MPGGALVQLVAQGNQEQILYGKPTITYFQTTLKQPTPFALEDASISFSGATDFNNKLTAQIPRTGDMLHHLYFVAELPELDTTAGTVAWTRSIGNIMIKDVSLLIGGSKIDSNWGVFMSAFAELTIDVGQRDNYNVLIGNTNVMTTQATTIPASKVTVPLQFAFSETTGLSLPIVCIQYHQISIEINLRPFNELVILSSSGVLSAVPHLSSASLLGEFVYLDVKERNQLAQNPYQSVITVSNYQGDESYSNNSIKSRLAFNHPTTFLMILVQPNANFENGANRWSDFTDGSVPWNGKHPLQTMKLSLNGTDRMDEQDAIYFNNLAPMRYFPNAPSTGIYIYPFGLKNSTSATGTLNLSRIDQAILQIRTNIPNNTAVTLRVFQKCFNVFRAKSGMAGLTFSS